MAAPYTKKQDGDDWTIEDGDGHVIATTETETLANFVMAALLGLAPEPPDYPSDEPQGKTDELGETSCYCQNCGYEGEENEVWSDVSGVKFVCPQCGLSAEVFPKDEEQACG